MFLAGIGTFLFLRLLPADPVAKFAGTLASEETYHITEQRLGLDQPIAGQLGSYLARLFRGDLGTSWVTGESVARELTVRFPVTFQLIILAFAIVLLIAVPVGLFIASRPGGRTDKVVTGYSLFAGAQPDFWWGIVFIYLLYFKLGWLPAPLGQLGNDVTPPPPVTHSVFVDSLLAGNFAAFWSAVQHYTLPLLTLVFVLSGPIIKMTRQGAEVVLGSDFVVYAKACGLPPSLIRREILRLSLAPVVTLVGILFGFMLGGAVLVEFVFSLNGLALFALQRTLALDFPAIQGAVLLMTTFALFVYVVMDVLHGALDPRVRLK